MNFITGDILVKCAIEEGLTLPEVSEALGARFPTLNKMGLMTNFVDEISNAFIENSLSEDCCVFEVGAAYGNIALEALQRGCENYIVNDLDERHLKILARRIFEHSSALLNKIKFIAGAYPRDINLEDNSVDFMLISRVLHFFSPQEIEATVLDIKRILKKNGKIFIICNSPYNKSFINFIPDFEIAKKNKKRFPGYVKNRENYVNRELYDSATIDSLYSGQFTYFDIDSFAEFFNNNDFIIEHACYIPYEKDNILSLDGRESVGAIIVKN